ncbi:hypothetical protein J4210_06205 [Candidatus Woesearchaeota archaeon]|nr:hypothetical protein [Candidatus Woesearchaeota archaeon]
MQKKALATSPRKRSFLSKWHFLAKAAVLAVFDRVQAIGKLVLAIVQWLFTFWAIAEHGPEKRDLL